MPTLYRIQYKVVEPGKTLSGVRIVEKPINEYVEFLRKTHPDATIVYLELLEEFEQEEESLTAKESIILLGFEYGPFI